MQVKQIGLLTAGGDGPGMNAAIRSVVRCALAQGFKVKGVLRGYDGLIKGEVVNLDHRSVANIINRGGTILKTARSKEIRTPAGLKKAVATIRQHELDALIAIGGDGTYRAANELFTRFHIPIVGLPGTIDNDLVGTDQTVSSNTAINTAIESIDKIRDTAHSMERIFVIEVMGNKSGFIAMQVALASGAEDVIIPEQKFNYAKLYQDMVEGNKKGKLSWMVIAAEGAAKAQDVAKRITQATGLETRYVVLGHVQRGGTPVASDRILATRLGAEAVQLIRKGKFGKAVGVLQNKIHIIDLAKARRRENLNYKENYKLLKILT